MADPLRVAFFGTPALAVPTLDALLARPDLCEVVAVVAQPDKPAGRGKKMRSPPTAARAKELGIALHQPRKVRSGAFPEAVEAMNLDVAVVIAYGRILTTRLLEAPRFGCVNVHASLLPAWRGAGPIQWSLAHGDPVTGVTTMWMEEGLDTGPMLLVEEEPIEPEDTASTLGVRLGALGASLLIRTLEEMKAGRLSATPQPSEGVSHAPLLSKEDGRIDWTRPAGLVSAHARGMTPWPGAVCSYRGRKLKVHQIEVAEGSGAAGTVLEAARDGVVVACGEGAVRLLRLQPPGKRALPAADFLNGYPMEPGESLAFATEEG
ncbi:MAG: methionyl-tRNA formyltransferase [Deltaproteobacteria bacterium]|nr:methionyl-tRNA formyltransferase [Deltaproteobacteria bacterium]